MISICHNFTYYIQSIWQHWTQRSFKTVAYQLWWVACCFASSKTSHQAKCTSSAAVSAARRNHWTSQWPRKEIFSRRNHQENNKNTLSYASHKIWQNNFICKGQLIAWCSIFLIISPIWWLKKSQWLLRLPFGFLFAAFILM